MYKKIAVIGGDLRQAVAAGLLSSRCEIAAAGFDNYRGDLMGDATRCVSVADAVKDASAVILPLPYSKDKLHIFAPLARGEILTDEVLSCISQDALLAGGMLDDYITGRHRRCADYYSSEELQVLNAIPTAEGAIGIAMEELPITLDGARALVIGFGRVGKVLSDRLKGMRAAVTVCARKESDLALAKALGFDPVGFDGLGTALAEADTVFNTVPAQVITPPLFCRIKRGAPVIDLASRPGGLDFEKAKQAGLNVIWALSLPGKVAPVTAGEIITRAVSAILQREGLS